MLPATAVPSETVGPVGNRPPAAEIRMDSGRTGDKKECSEPTRGCEALADAVAAVPCNSSQANVRPAWVAVTHATRSARGGVDDS